MKQNLQRERVRYLREYGMGNKYITKYIKPFSGQDSLKAHYTVVSFVVLNIIKFSVCTI